MRSIYIIAVLACLLLQTATAQVREHHWTVAAGAGAVNYYGDLSYKYFNAKDSRVSYSAFAERVLAPGISLRLQYLGGKITANDRADFLIRDNNAMVNPSYGRSLNFQSRFHDLNAAVVFYFDNGKILSTDAKVSPYFFVGAGVGRFKVFGDLLSAEGGRYHYWQDNTIRDLSESDPNADMANIIAQDGFFETELSGLDIETNYSQIKFQVPVGMGLKFRLGDQFSLRLESQLVYNFNDYLDDVGGRSLPNDFPDDFTAYAADPADFIDGSRGNIRNGLHDMYLITNASITYSFGRQRSKFQGLEIKPIILEVHEAVPTAVIKKDTLSALDTDLNVEFSPQDVPSPTDVNTITLPVEREEVIEITREIVTVKQDVRQPTVSGPKYIVYAETAIFEPHYYNSVPPVEKGQQIIETPPLAPIGLIDSLTVIEIVDTSMQLDTSIIKEVAIIEDTITGVAIALDTIPVVEVEAQSDTLTLEDSITVTDTIIQVHPDSTGILLDTTSTAKVIETDSTTALDTILTTPTIDPVETTMPLDTLIDTATNIVDEDLILMNQSIENSKVDTVFQTVVSKRDSVVVIAGSPDDSQQQLREVRQSLESMQADMAQLKQSMLSIQSGLARRDTARITVILDTISGGEQDINTSRIMDQIDQLKTLVLRIDQLMEFSDTLKALPVPVRDNTNDSLLNGISLQLAIFRAEMLSDFQAFLQEVQSDARKDSVTTDAGSQRQDIGGERKEDYATLFSFIDSLQRQNAAYYQAFIQSRDSSVSTPNENATNAYLIGLMEELRNELTTIQATNANDDYRRRLDSLEFIFRMNENTRATTTDAVDVATTADVADIVQSSLAEVDIVETVTEANQVDEKTSTTPIEIILPDKEEAAAEKKVTDSTALQTLNLLNAIINRLDKLEKVDQQAEVIQPIEDSTETARNTDNDARIKFLEDQLNKVTADYTRLSDEVAAKGLVEDIQPVIVKDIEEARPIVVPVVVAKPTVKVFFKSNQTEVEGVHYTKLNRVAEYLQSYPESTVEIRGYADPSGNADYNLKLSRLRADNVRRILLLQLDIEPTRIRVISMGEEAASDNLPDYSRRVEIEVK